MKARRARRDCAWKPPPSPPARTTNRVAWLAKTGPPARRHTTSNPRTNDGALRRRDSAARARRACPPHQEHKWAHDGNELGRPRARETGRAPVDAARRVPSSRAWRGTGATPARHAARARRPCLTAQLTRGATTDGRGGAKRHQCVSARGRDGSVAPANAPRALPCDKDQTQRRQQPQQADVRTGTAAASATYATGGPTRM